MARYELTRSGRQARDDCVNEMENFKNYFRESIVYLSREYGIGTELLVGKMQDLLSDVDELQKRVRNMPEDSWL